MSLPRPGPSTGLALFTDLYQLTMAQAYWADGMDADAVFSLFVRRLPEGRNFLTAAGLDPLLDLSERIAFSDEDLAYLATLPGFSEPFLERLRGFRFTGSVRAVAEGTPIFAHEPLLEIRAPVIEAQLLETLVMNQVGLQTLLASKAERVVTAADGRAVLDFGTRRAHGIDAALDGARAFAVAGVAATSNVLAGARLGLPVAGTMAHSYVAACASELEAFRRFAALYPETVLLVDTYNTLDGVRRVVALARELGDDFRVKGIRIDSGDLAVLSRAAREILDAAGLDRLTIAVSGGLDERKIAELLAAGAPIDAFGVGTDMSTSGDAPSLDIVYKITEYAGRGRVKLAANKSTLPGAKQVFRTADGDLLGLSDEAHPGAPLLQEAMRDGRRTAAPKTIAEIRAHAAACRAALPAEIQGLAPASRTPEISAALRAADAEARAEVEAQAAR